MLQPSLSSRVARDLEAYIDYVVPIILTTGVTRGRQRKLEDRLKIANLLEAQIGRHGTGPDVDHAVHCKFGERQCSIPFGLLSSNNHLMHVLRAST